MKIWTILAPATAVCGVVILFAQQRPAGPSTPDQAAKQAKQEQQAPRGITVAGEVKDFVAVTDAMLRSPDPPIGL
jgi:hypothetical protein